MPITRQQRTFASVYAGTGDHHYAAARAGWSATSGAASKALAKADVQAEIARVTNARLFNELLPLAVDGHARLLKDPNTPAGALVQAIKLAYERTLDVAERQGEGALHEYTAERLGALIAAIEAKHAPVIEGQADDAELVEEPEPEPPAPQYSEGLFG